MRDSRKIETRIRIKDKVYTNDNLSSVSFEYGSLDGPNFALGASVASSVRIVFVEIIEGLKELDEIKVEMGAELPDGTVEYVKMGTFIINERVEIDRNGDTTKLSAMDKMVMMGAPYVSKLGTSARIRDIALEIANLSGVEVDGSFANLRATNIKIPTGYSYREAIGVIAQFESGFATFNREGKLQIKRLNNTTFKITPDRYVSKGLVKNEVLFRIDGITCITGDGERDVLTAGNPSGTQITLNNNSMTQSELNRIFQDVRTINYFPFSLSWYGNPLLESGDYIEIEDLKGNRFKTPNLSYSLEFNGGLKATSRAESESSSEVVYNYTGPLRQQINYIQSRLSANGENRIFDDITEPTNPEIGDIWFKPNGPDIELWIYGKKEDGTLGWIAKITNENLDQAKREIEEALISLEEYKNEIDASIDDLNTTIGNTFTSLDDTMNQLSSISEQTRLNAEAAQAQSLTALSDAQKAQKNATDALTAARQGLSALEDVESSISTIDYEIDELNGSLSLKASQTDMNKLTGKVEQHTFDISVNANGLKTKAAQSTVDTLSGTVTTLSGELTVQAGLLKSKIGMTEVNGAIGNLEIGERNLVLKSDEKKKSSNYNFAQYTLSTPWESGIDYYIVLKAKPSATKSHIGAYANGGTFTLGSLTYDAKYDVWRGVARTTQSTTMLHLFQFPNNNATMEVDWIKVVKGTKTSFDWSQAPEDVQGQFKSMETDIEQTASAIKLKADQTTVDTLNGRVSTLNSQLTVQAGQISGKVSMTEVNGAIGDLDLEGRNLVVRNDEVSGWLVSDGVLQPNHEMRTIKSVIKVTPGETLIFSKTSVTGDNYWRWNNYNSAVAYQNRTVNNSNFFTWTVPSGIWNIKVSYPYLSRVKIERSSKYTGFSLAPEDMASTSFVESEVKQTADEISGSISSLSGEVSLQKQTLTSFTQSLMDPNTGRLVKAEQNLDGLKNTVSNKADQTQVTTLANGFSVLSKQTIQNKINIESDGFVLWSDWSRGSEISSYNVSGEGFAVQQTVNNNTQGGNNRVWYSKESGFLTPGVTYTVTIIINSDAVNREFSMGQGSNPGNQRFRLTNTPTKYSFVFEAVNTNTFSVYFHNAGAYRIRHVTVVEGGGASQSQLAVLTNQIDMAVREGDVIGRINIQAGRTLLQNKKIYMDAESVIFSGKAFIPDAAITSMTADKITAGVIDATKITVINLDARALTSGTISGTNSSWNLNTGRMEFTNPGTNDTVAFTQGQILFNRGSQSRQLNYFAEGLELLNGPGNTGTGLNTSLRLASNGRGSYKYIQFSDPNYQQRLLALDNHMYLMPGTGGRVIMQIYNSNVGGSGYAGVEASYYETQHTTGNTVRMIGDRIETPRTGSRDIFLSPNGTGVVRVGNTAGDYYNIRASTFLNSSSRKLKTNIDESSQNALSVLNALTIVEYNLKSDLKLGIENRQIGLIAEESLLVASSDGESIDTYRLLSYNTKAIQELNSLQEKLETKLETKLFNYDSKIFQLEAKVTDLEQQIKELKGAA